MLEKEEQTVTRSEMKRSAYHKKKKYDRLLNILIAIISILIIINFVTLLSDNKEQSKEVAKENVKNEQQDESTNHNQEDNGVIEEGQNNESISEGQSSSEEGASDDGLNSSEGEIIVHTSDDPNVIEAIENPQWDVTPTQQTGEHISAYQNGHIDYEEKLMTFRNVVNLDENNIIYWAVKNNGSTSHSVGIVSTMDKSEIYRIFIEWVDGKGWKPVKLERLRQVEGTF